jgi:hypothetical protein
MINIAELTKNFIYGTSVDLITNRSKGLIYCATDCTTKLAVVSENIVKDLDENDDINVCVFFFYFC